jgi:hypothetical protein
LVLVKTWTEVQDDLFGKPGTPARAKADASFARYSRKMKRAERATNWLRIFGPIGDLARVFWFLVLTEDDHNPRDGLEFSFLNDGYKPTWWHTWYSIRHDNLCPYSGIYPEGAPRSWQEAYDRAEAHKA